MDAYLVTLWVASISVYVGASQRIPLFWCKIHIKGLRARSLTRPEGRGKEGLRSFGRREQSREERRRDQSTEQVSQEMSLVERRSVNISQKGDC